MRCTIFVLLLAIAISIDCTASQDFLKIIRTTKTYANEESHKVFAGSTQKLEGTGFANNEVRTTEYCMDKGTNSLYTLKLYDSANDSWIAGSFIELYNVYGISLVKRFMKESTEESFQFSLLMPIVKGATWKHSASYSSNWQTTGFSDSSWNSLVTPGPSGTVETTNYFRATFAAPIAYAAYEARLNYRHGILVHVNGAEIFRDNMDAGAVSHTTASSGSYSNNVFRGIIRNAYGLTTSGNVIAVEIHIEASSSPSLEFDGYLMLHASNSATGHNCYVITQTADVVASSGGTYGASMIDGGKTSYFYATNLATTPGTCTFTYTNNPLFAQFNAMEYYIGTTNTVCPKDFQLMSSRLPASAGVYTPFATLTGKASSTLTYHTWIAPFSVAMANSFRLHITATASTYTYVYEGFPAVCGVQFPPSLTFEKSSFTIKSSIDSLVIRPIELGVSACTISPDPTQYGFAWNAGTCTMSGMSNSTFSTTFTWSFNTGVSTVTGQVSINSSACSDSVLALTRYYPSSSPIDEIYSVENMAGTYMFGETYNSGQTASGTFYFKYCVPPARYKLTMGINNNIRTYWYVGSQVTFHLDHGTYQEVMFRTRYDLMTSLPIVNYFSAVVPVKTTGNWYYKHDYSNADWHSGSTSGWSQGTVGNFGSSSSVYQVFRRTFTVSSDDLIYAGGFSMRIAYQYGIIMMLNGHEIFRNNLGEGVLSSASVTGTYASLNYRGMSFPTSTMKIGDEVSKQYIVVGENSLAIAFKGLSTSGWASTFSCSLLLFGDPNADRVFHHASAISGMSGTAESVWQKYYSQYISSASCTVANYVQLEFADDRREWISAAALVSYYGSSGYYATQFKVYAKNPADSDFTLLSTQTGWKWWSKAQWKRFFIVNNKSYNIYRFADVGTGNPSACEWRINDIVLYADKSDVVLPALSYTASNSGYKDIEFAELFPTNNNLRGDFTISPALPAGLFIDPPSGTIVGTPTELMSNTQYTVSFMNVGGTTGSASFYLEIIVCSGGRALISVVIRVDTYPAEVQYNLYQGRGNTGTRIAYRTDMPAGSIYYWVDQCLNNGIYTFEGIDTYGDGWAWPANWRLTIDYDWLSVAYAHIPSATKPVISTHTFSSHLPFQIELSDWKLYKLDTAPDSSWHDVSFTDSNWETVKAANIGIPSTPSIYFRQKFDIPSLNDYKVLNMHARFSCGMIAYFNSKVVARFNLPAKVTHNTPCSVAQHDNERYLRFHAILETDGAIQTGNVMAFEVHKGASSSSSEPFVFDASGIFGVQSDCNFVVSSYYNTTSTWDSNDYAAAFDMVPLSYVTISNVANNYMSFSHENLAPVRWNAYYMSTNSANTGLSWTIDGRFEHTSDWVDTVVQSSVTLANRGMTKFYDDIAMAGFTHLRFYITVGGPGAWQVSEFATLYCHATGTVCQGDNDFPTVGNGAKSPALCPAHYTGYRFKVCTSGSFGPEDDSLCVMALPEHLSYKFDSFRFVRDIPSTTEVPTYENIVTKFEIANDKPLPFGLALNPTTGEISGSPGVETPSTEYRILASNKSGTTLADITIEVRIGACKPDGIFKGANVDETVTYDCANEGSSIGTRTRKCKLGAIDGEWEAAQGMCWQIIMIVFMVIVLVIILAVAVFILTRSKGKKKAGGSKKSSGSKSGKKVNKV